ncbi:MAG: sigma-70 family RNA polymerase sigma factor [Acholeplasmatales bacterium]|nr:sigma-70 family RNA polymerase sigma factor [Acholeplasmatales bacterium]
MDLEKIVLKYKETKDEIYFNKLYLETNKLVKSIIYQYCAEKNIIDDLTQDVYLKIVKNIDNYETKNFYNYLYLIAKNTAIDYTRKTRELPNLDPSYIPDNSINPYLNFALSHLDNNLKEIFIMKVLLGYTTKKISEILNSTPKKINNAYYKAKEILKHELEGIKDEIK